MPPRHCILAKLVVLGESVTNKVNGAHRVVLARRANIIPNYALSLSVSETSTPVLCGRCAGLQMQTTQSLERIFGISCVQVASGPRAPCLDRKECLCCRFYYKAVEL